MKHSPDRELIPYDHKHQSFRTPKRSQAIYVLLLVLLVSTLISLPLIETGEFSSSPGRIRTNSEPILVRAAVSGRIKGLGPGTNSFVHLGDTLMVLSHSQIKGREKTLAIQAPASGILSHPERVRKGACVIRGDLIAQIMPETGLIANCPGGRQLTRKVISISPEVALDPGRPIFEFSGSPDSLPASPALPLAGQSRARPGSVHLRNGMTLITRFRLARRSVFDLVYGKGAQNQSIRL